ncbi:hypothetical protein MRB53_021194 [Persea americana]|uniref:Uncharacterized protein n=1 Tax=Persea americana TaxID=3435 RepID=A0ACC2L480_PERAE|nr:hypothetical protein MRB53_021194 [Persea americana]
MLKQKSRDNCLNLGSQAPSYRRKHAKAEVHRQLPQPGKQQLKALFLYGLNQQKELTTFSIKDCEGTNYTAPVHIENVFVDYFQSIPARKGYSQNAATDLSHVNITGKLNADDAKTFCRPVGISEIESVINSSKPKKIVARLAATSSLTALSAIKYGAPSPLYLKWAPSQSFNSLEDQLQALTGCCDPSRIDNQTLAKLSFSTLFGRPG